MSDLGACVGSPIRGNSFRSAYSPILLSTNMFLGTLKEPWAYLDTYPAGELPNTSRKNPEPYGKGMRSSSRDRLSARSFCVLSSVAPCTYSSWVLPTS